MLRSSRSTATVGYAQTSLACHARNARGSYRGECVKLPTEAGAIGGDAIAHPTFNPRRIYVESKLAVVGICLARSNCVRVLALYPTGYRQAKYGTVSTF